MEIPVELTKEQDQENQINELKDADIEELVANEPYTIAKGRDKMQILKSKHFIKQENMIAHAFVDAKEKITDLESSSYVEATSCKDVAQ